MWSNADQLKKFSPYLLWAQNLCVCGGIVTSILRVYVDFFWTPIVFGSGALICSGLRYYVDRQAGRLTSKLHSERIDTVSQERQEGDLHLQSQITPVRRAFEPRTVTPVQRDQILSMLLHKDNTSPKPRVRLIVPNADSETHDFAEAIGKLLMEAGYRKHSDTHIRAEAQLALNEKTERRSPHLFALFSSDDKTIPPATIGGSFGSIKVFHATPFSIKDGDTSHPQAYRHTNNVNDIMYGLAEVLRFAGFRVGTLSGHGILRRGQIGFYIPRQI